MRPTALVVLAAACALTWTVGCSQPPRAEARGNGRAASRAIVDTTWAWTMLISTADRPAIRIGEAGRYTLTLGPNGSLHGSADCQAFTGAFDVEGSRLQLTVNRADSAECPIGSYATQYVRLLTQVATYTMDGRGLILHLRSAGGTMVFLPIA